MLLSYIELCELIEQGVIDAPIKHVNGSSIDITLGNEFMTESYNIDNIVVDLTTKESITMDKFVIEENHRVILLPGHFCLATSRETFNLPSNISAMYKLKSSMARNGLEHLNAGWCDPTWHNAKLTLELKNMTMHHHLALTPRMKIGQIIFFKNEPVPVYASYAEKGQYNHQETVTASKGIQ